MIKYTLIPALCFCICSLLEAQIPSGGRPFGFHPEAASLPPPSEEVLPAPDFDHWLQEDREYGFTARFAAPVDLSLDIALSGSWTTLPDSSRLLRQTIRVREGLGLLLVFNQFRLPEGATLFFYSADKKQLLGAFTARNNRPSGKFLAGIIRGEAVVIEYREPGAGSRAANAQLQLSKVFVVYKPEALNPDHPLKAFQAQGFGDALPCHINARCPQAAGHSTSRRSAMRILRVFEQGAGWCSGSLINNTAEDGTPYLLSAFHCSSGYTPIFDLWRFDFAYEFPTCQGDTMEPQRLSLLGCSKVAGRVQSDFLLLRLFSPAPYILAPYFNGWNRNPSYQPDTSIYFHHPQGDVKKFARDDDQATIHPSPLTWDNGVTTPPNHHFRVVLDEGTVEGGSSGAPLLDQNGRLVGQLHGGATSCSQFTTYSGRLAMSWDQGNEDSTRLREWLDPLDTGVMTLDGLGIPDTLQELRGTVLTCQDIGIGMVTVVLHKPGGADTVITNGSGTFSFSDIPIGEGWHITLHKNINPTNGTTVFDNVLIAQHILQIDPFQDPCQLIAADIDRSGTISTIDIINLQQVILQLVPNFTNNTSWVFDNPDIQIDLLPVFANDLVIYGLKTGDVSGDADPGQ